MVLNSWNILRESPDEVTENDIDGLCSSQDKKEDEHIFTRADASIDQLVKQFETPLLNANIEIPSLKMEFKNLADYVTRHYKVESMDYVNLWRIIFQLQSLGNTEYSNILKLAELCFSFAVSNAVSESGFSNIKRTETNSRSRLSENHLTTIMQISMDGLPYLTYDSSEAVESFLRKKCRRLGGDSKKRPAIYYENEVSERQPKQSKNFQKRVSVQKKLYDLFK